MLEFIKNFFNDEKAIVGLSSLGLKKTVKAEISARSLFCDNPPFDKTFETRFNKNVLLM